MVKKGLVWSLENRKCICGLQCGFKHHSTMCHTAKLENNILNALLDKKSKMVEWWTWKMPKSLFGEESYSHSTMSGVQEGTSYSN